MKPLGVAIFVRSVSTHYNFNVVYTHDRLWAYELPPYDAALFHMCGFCLVIFFFTVEGIRVII